MDATTFKRILLSFADAPAHLDMSKGQLLAQIRDEVISASVTMREGSVRVTENDEDYSAESWIIKRVARLPLLADRIISYIPSEPNFVTPAGRLIEQLEAAPDEAEQEVDNAAQATKDILSRRPADTASTLYLTSDAGEGKTTLINTIARDQAFKYKEKATDWLLVPVYLGGRTFLRLDDIVVAALLNRLRFPFLYYDAFIELVRLGVVVPAFDGFEEVFVQSSSGEAASALGNLLKTVRSAGSLLISARRAFFEYKDLQSQGKLIDTLGKENVAFARLQLQRWDKRHFAAYCTKRTLADGNDIYDLLANRLGQCHPLISRAVMVSKVVDIVSKARDRAAFLRRMTELTDAEAYFVEFVDALIDREVEEKWINRAGDVAGPLLTRGEHHELLSLVAEEMWEHQVDSLKGDLLDTVAEMFCENRKKDVLVARQVVDRLRHHALLTTAVVDGDFYCFDHEEFRMFFLGEAVGRSIEGGSRSRTRSLLNVIALPDLAVRTSVQWLQHRQVDSGLVIQTLQECGEGEGRTSFVRENCGSIVARLLPAADQGIAIKNLSFASDSLSGLTIQNVVFENCYFQSHDLTTVNWKNVTLRNCEFESLLVPRSATAPTSVSFDACEVRRVARGDDDYRVFDPAQIRTALTTAGYSVRPSASVDEGGTDQMSLPLETDESLRMALKAIRAFMRATELNENVFRAKFGAKFGKFADEILPGLLDAQVLREIPYQGHGSQRRFKIASSMQRIQRAEAECEGQFETFLGLLRARD